PLEVAESMLHALEGAMRIFEKHRQLVLDQLKRPPSDKGGQTVPEEILGRLPKRTRRGLKSRSAAARNSVDFFYTTFRNLCSERSLSGRALSLKVCVQLVHGPSPPS